MQEFEKKKMMQNFDKVIEYYQKIKNNEKIKIYADMKDDYLKMIDSFEILPEPEQERIKNIEKIITSEMVYINEVENNDKQ